MFDSEDEELYTMTPSTSWEPLGPGPSRNSSFGVGRSQHPSFSSGRSAPSTSFDNYSGNINNHQNPRERNNSSSTHHSLSSSSLGYATQSNGNSNGNRRGFYSPPTSSISINTNIPSNGFISPSSPRSGSSVVNGFHSPVSVSSLYIDDEDFDPFYDYPDEKIYTGIALTSELTRKEDSKFSFYIFCQETIDIHGVPRHLTTPPPKITLNKLSRWRRKFELEFGKIILFIFDHEDNVLVFKKGPSDSIPVDVVNNHYCFKACCVFNETLDWVHTHEFGSIKLKTPLEDLHFDLVYEGLIEFDDPATIRRIKSFTVYKILSVATEQTLTFSAPWSRLNPDVNLDLNEEDAPESQPVIGNKSGFRYNNNGIIHLKTHYKDAIENDIIICFEREREFPIGSIFSMDYIPHPTGKYYAITEAYRLCETLETIEVENGFYIFTIELDVSHHEKGFFYHETLGMIADSRGCLRYLPYAHNREIENPETRERERDDIFTVRVCATPNELAKFDIYELTEETIEKTKKYEPKLLSTYGFLINCETGRLYCKDYPSIQLFIDETELPKFDMGDFVTGKFNRRDIDDPYDNNYISVKVEHSSSAKLKCLKIQENYGVFVFHGSLIKYEAPKSKAYLKKKRIEQVIEPDFPEYNFYFQGFLDSMDSGLIAGYKIDPETTKVNMHMIIAETNLDPNRQTAFKYVCKFLSNNALDIHKNTVLAKHVAKRLNIFENAQDEDEFFDARCESPTQWEDCQSDWPEEGFHKWGYDDDDFEGEYPNNDEPGPSSSSGCCSKKKQNRKALAAEGARRLSEYNNNHHQIHQNNHRRQSFDEEISNPIPRIHQNQHRQSFDEDVAPISTPVPPLPIIEPPTRPAEPPLGKLRYRNVILYLPNREIESIQNVAMALNSIEDLLHRMPPPQRRNNSEVKMSRNQAYAPEIDQIAKFFGIKK